MWSPGNNNTNTLTTKEILPIMIRVSLFGIYLFGRLFIGMYLANSKTTASMHGVTHYPGQSRSVLQELVPWPMEVLFTDSFTVCPHLELPLSRTVIPSVEKPTFKTGRNGNCKQQAIYIFLYLSGGLLGLWLHPKPSSPCAQSCFSHFLHKKR